MRVSYNHAAARGFVYSVVMEHYITQAPLAHVSRPSDQSAQRGRTAGEHIHDGQAGYSGHSAPGGMNSGNSDAG